MKVQNNIVLNSDLGGFSFKEEAGIKYVRGADSVWVPFSSIAYIANFKGKYGTGNNSVISLHQKKSKVTNLHFTDLQIYTLQEQCMLLQ